MTPRKYPLRLLLPYLLLCGILFSLFPVTSYAGNTVVVIDRNVIDSIRGDYTVWGVISRVGHKSIYVKSDGGKRIKIDLRDIKFPADLDEIFAKGMEISATGKKIRSTLKAYRISLLDKHEIYKAKSKIRIKVKNKDKGDIDILLYD